MSALGVKHSNDPSEMRRGALDATWRRYDTAKNEVERQQLRAEIETLAWRIWLNKK